jgi:hypothetical protein
MNTSIIRALVAVCLGAASLLAQDSIHVKIPFDFTIGAQSFRAGDYAVKENLGSSVVAIQSADHRASVMALTYGVQAHTKPGEAKLVFHRYGDHYFLSQVWTGRNDAGRQLLPSRAEQELIASARLKPVTLVASTK